MKILQSVLKQLPKMPGVYLFKDKSSTIIYIGKAKNLFNRVHSYFLANTDVKTSILSRKIYQIEYFITNNEIEALLLENNLIKKHQPKFNIKLKDSKSYPMLKITAENLPRVLKCREKVNSKDEYFGPYISAREIKSLLNIFTRIYKTRTCGKKFKPPYNGKPCLNYYIDLCCAPCAGYISEEDYNRSINEIRKILKGKTRDVKKSLQEKMIEYSNNQEYEQAAIVRDNLQLVINFEQEQFVSSISNDDYDYIGFYLNSGKAAISLLQEREGVVTGKQNFFISALLFPDNLNLFVFEFLREYYLNTTQIPRKIVIGQQFENIKSNESEAEEEKNILLSAIFNKYQIKTEFKSPYATKEKRLLKLAEENAEIFYEEKQYKINKIHHLRDLKKILNLPALPRIIECFDVATLDGKFNTAAMVSFVDGAPDKSRYRQFNIAGEGHPDDYHMMEEVIGRRYQKLKNEKKKLPDLIVVDGGKGQLNSALKILRILALDIPVIGLAKKFEHIFIEGKKTPIILDKNNYALKLIQAIRDESHRFSNVRLSKRYKNATLKSELMNIKGLGEKRANLLLRKFKSVKSLKNADLEEVAKTAGIGAALAKTIFDYFGGNTSK